LFADRLALVVLGVVAVIAAATFRDYGLGWDDYTHSEYGDLLLAFYGSGFSDQRALSFVNLYKYGGGFDMAAALAAKRSSAASFSWNSFRNFGSASNISCASASRI